MKITIDGNDRTANIPIESIEINNVLTRQIDTARFTVEDGNAFNLQELDEVIISNDAETTRYFAGFIEKLEEVEADSGLDLDYRVVCTDYTWLLEHPEELVNEEYEDETDQAMIQDFMATSCPDIEVSTYVDELFTYDGIIQWPRKAPREIIEKLADAAGGDYYVDYGPTAGAELAHLYYFDTGTYTAPFDLSDSPDMSTTYPVEDLQKTTHAPAANLVDVIGDTYLGADHTFYLMGDGDKTVLDLPYRIRKPSTAASIQVWVWDGAAWDGPLDVGTKYLHDDDLGTTYDVLYAYKEQYLEFDTAPGDYTQAVKITARQEIPVRVRVRSYASETRYGRWIAAKLVDSDISTRDDARRRGQTFLAQEALAAPRFRCVVRELGLKAGQVITLTIANRGLDDEYMIQRVRTRFEAGGDVAVCDVELGVYDPDLIDAIIMIKRMRADDYIEDEELGVLDDLLESSDTFDLTDTSEDVDNTGTSYDWAAADAGDDPLIWSFGRWS